MENLPAYLEPLFVTTVLLTIILFAQATPSKLNTTVFLVLWGGVFGALGYIGFFTNISAMPPRFVFMMGPAVVLILLMFVTKKGKTLTDRLDLKALTGVHLVRLPVEIILMILAIGKAVPTEVTFEGRNFDIIMGLTALPVSWLIFKRNKSKKLLLAWNILGILLLMNVVIHGVLSLPYPFQQISFEQPNLAMLYGPYNLLPGLIVPVVMFSHLAAIRKLLSSGERTNVIHG